MNTYTLYVHDDRYTVPTLMTVESRDDERVRTLAHQRLQESSHYRTVEIWDDDRFVAEVQLLDGATGPA